jgi:hypothetical protein
MTNRLSILEKVNGDGSGVYGDFGQFGEFRAKGQKSEGRGLLRVACSVCGGVVAESLLRILGYLPAQAKSGTEQNLLGPATGKPPEPTGWKAAFPMTNSFGSGGLGLKKRVG